MDKKKVFISADIEGITGVTSWSETNYGEDGYEQACRQMTAEVVAACKGAIKHGYEVVVKDGHGSARNIDGADLPRGVQLIRGWMTSPPSMMGGLDESFDAAIYIGYHSPEGSDCNPLAHTSEHDIFNYFKLNDKLASEFTLNALWAAAHKVPSVFLSGDEGMCRLAETDVPGIFTVSTKTGIGNATWNKHPEDVVQLIEEGVGESLKKGVELVPLNDKYKMTVNFKEHQNARRASWYPGATQLDSNTVEYTSESIKELWVARMFMTEV